jgi:hypothetical protein|tara:strand:+ start:72 stop:491 length:420 start_codon:yes stop_codon:yes gene_type:complete
MAFATNNNLQEYAPDVFEQGIDDWTDELAKAEVDVINTIQYKWFNKYYSRSQFNSTLLVEAQWTKSTVYQALYAYILPRLSTFRPEGDPFREQLVFYKERFNEELDIQFGIGIKYDFENDGSIDTDTDIKQASQQWLVR